MAENVTAKLVGRLAQIKSDFRINLSGVRSNRANPTLVEGIEVDAYGSKMKLRDLAHISAPEPRLLVVQPWDAGLVEGIAKSLGAAGLGINPAVDGGVIRLPLPALTEERRAELVKLVNAKLEEARVQLRQARHDSMAELARLEDSKEITEDDRERSEGQMQKEVDRVTGELDQMAEAKELEVKTI